LRHFQAVTATLSARFNRIFGCKTGSATLDRLLARLLKVLERPDVPLNTNGFENDIRCKVTKRKFSGGTCSDLGRDCRDAFLGLLGIVRVNSILAARASERSGAPLFLLMNRQRARSGSTPKMAYLFALTVPSVACVLCFFAASALLAIPAVRRVV